MDHPRLLFDVPGLAAIRAKIVQPQYRADWEAVRFQADWSIAFAASDLRARNPESYYRSARRAARCAFAHLVAGDERHAEAARSHLRALSRVPDWTSDGSGRMFGMWEGMTTCYLAQAYDWSAATLPTELRDDIAGRSRAMIAMFVANCRSPENVYLSGARTMNHLAVQASGAVCLALAVRENDLDLACEIEIARAHLLRFLDWYDDAGGAIEIGSYWGFANEYVLRALLALKRHGWADIFHQRAMKLERYLYPTLCMSIGGKYVTNFCDGTYGDDIVYDGPGGDVVGLARERVMPVGGDPRGVTFRTRSAALVLAAEFRDRRLQWMAERLPHGDELALISGDPEFVASPPDDLPTTIVYHGCGVGILRSSMTDPDAIFLGLKAGRARGLVFDDPHCQSDLNTVVLDGLGTTLLADPGYRHDFNGSMSNLDPAHPSNSTPPHNTLLVAGGGQIHADSPVAHLQDLSPSDDIDYIVSRIERGYGPDVLRFDRHAYLIAKRVVVLIDDIELSAPRELCWNFHGKESAAVAAGPSPTITCDGVRLRIIPFGLPLAVATASDHVLPRLRFDARPVARARVGWLLPIDRVGVDPLAVSAGFVDDHAQVQTLGRTWRLPVIVRRSSFRSDLMLPFPRK